jgi:peptide/nickel transport system substrate-binding protein
MQLYKQMNQMIISEAVVVPLFYDMVVRFYPKNIKGFSGNPLNLLYLKEVKKINN